MNGIGGMKGLGPAFSNGREGCVFGNRRHVRIALF